MHKEGLLMSRQDGGTSRAPCNKSSLPTVTRLEVSHCFSFPSTVLSVSLSISFEISHNFGEKVYKAGFFQKLSEIYRQAFQMKEELLI